MLNLPFLLTALIVGLATGLGLTAWVRARRRHQLEVTEGIRSLAAMRWREFSRFVIEALQAQGFEAARGDAATQGAQQSDLVLDRNGETWLLSVKQGANYRITAQMVEELERAVRFRNAQGGILVTLGTIEPGAGRAHPQLELLDGATLWPVVGPLLPPSLHQDINTRAQATVRRETSYAWGVAAVVGLLVGAVVGLLTAGSSDSVDVAESGTASEIAPATATAAATPATPAPASTSAIADGTPLPPPAAPAGALDEEAERKAVQADITTVSGVERTAWTSRSTLVIYMPQAASEAQVKSICALVERHDSLRAIRLQIQPPPGSALPVRFLQCRAF